MQFTIKTNSKEEMIDITERVKEIVDKVCDEDSRACLVYVPHTTCGVLINENYDKNVCDDILEFLRKLVKKDGWKHSEGNSDAHIKASLIGVSKVIPVKSGLLQLGRWQGIMLAEFDGPREREVIVNVV